MSMYRSRTLGRSLGAFSAFAGGGRNIFGPFAFAESWSSDDYETATHFRTWVKPYLDQANRKDLTYEPVSTSIRTRAAAVYKTWKEAADLGNATATAYVEKIKNEMNDLIARADELTLAQSLGKRSIGVEVSRYEAFNAINTIIKQVGASTSKANAALAAANAEGSAIPEGDMVGSANDNAGTVSTSSRSASTNAGGSPITGQGGDPNAVGGTNWLLYGGIGAAALLLLGGGIFLARRPRAATARYGRHKRRSRR